MLVLVDIDIDVRNGQVMVSKGLVTNYGERGLQNGGGGGT